MSIGVIVFLVILAFGGLALVGAAVWSVISMHRESSGNELPDEPLPEPVALPAKVIDRHIHMQHTGSYKMPSHALLYYVTFLKEDGNTVEFCVPLDVYELCLPGKTGTLVTLDGEFFDFGNGEEIA